LMLSSICCALTDSTVAGKRTGCTS
jgi:hypothetical protein